jgi:hypothetical protein
MTHSFKSQFLGAALGAALIGSTVLAAHAASPAASAAAGEPSVLVFNQKAQGSQVTIDYAYLPANGYVVIYGADKNGNPSREPLGHAEVKAGDHRSMKISLSEQPASGTKLWATLYRDQDAKPGFDKSADQSWWGSALPAENRFVIQ